MRGFLLINPRSGRGRPTAEELLAEARACGVDTHLLQPGDDPAALARASEAEALGVAGGDGSLAPVAAVAVERRLPFVSVPFGTRNHFARDLGIDRDDPVAALSAFDGEERLVDVARVDGRLFLNNVSLGLYAALVHRREHHRRRGQVLAGARALGLIARRRHGLHARVGGEHLSARIVLVANNAYELRLFEVGARDTLDEGRLHLYAARGWLPSAWSERIGRAFRLEAEESPLRAAIDGEPVDLDPPLAFEVEPRALRVRVARENG